jgi:hypothetical protein
MTEKREKKGGTGGKKEEGSFPWNKTPYCKRANLRKE